ncbi:MAG: 50S ribosomal protein L10 [bacterium]
MAITRQKKEEIVAKAQDIVSHAKTLVFAKFKGLPVEEQSELRSAFRGQSVGYTVIKKTLLKRALDAQQFGGEMPVLEGEISLAYGEDELAPARELAVFVKKFPEHLAFAGGVFGGRFVNADEIKAIAAIPGIQTLRVQFVQLINSPRQRFAVVLNAKAEKEA